jgi:hypothetical protein
MKMIIDREVTLTKGGKSSVPLNRTMNSNNIICKMKHEYNIAKGFTVKAAGISLNKTVKRDGLQFDFTSKQNDTIQPAYINMLEFTTEEPEFKFWLTVFEKGQV